MDFLEAYAWKKVQRNRELLQDMAAIGCDTTYMSLDVLRARVGYYRGLRGVVRGLVRGGLLAEHEDRYMLTETGRAEAAEPFVAGCLA